MSLVWATRGRTWGFRFLLDGGLIDPLKDYEAAFSGLEDEREVFRRVGSRVAIRFLDPEGRTDRSGRTIPHDFLADNETAANITSFDGGRTLLWELVGEQYARAWDLPEPPAFSVPEDLSDSG